MIHKLTGSSSPLPEPSAREVSSRRGIAYWLSWIPAVLMLAWLGYVVLLKVGVVEAARTTLERQSELAKVLPSDAQSEAQLPDLTFSQPVSVSRVTEMDTLVPSRPRTEPQKYVVQAGDSVFSIAQQFNLKPETVLWANYNLLNDNPNMLSIGQELVIPAVDGVLYEPKPGETIEEVARKFKATPEDIISWPANKIDVADPKLVAGQTIMIPNGEREMRSWVVPTIWRANSGANKTVNAACDTSGVNVYGTGYFMWPADNHSISGNTFWSGHLGIDIAAAMGAPIYAADSGVVVYSAPIGGGYGNMVMIDHGNGFHTLYAHNSQLLVRCGQGVSKGQVIAYAGSTGNSTGPHLHFEIRYLGAFVNPLDYLR